MMTQYASRSIGGFDDAVRNHVEDIDARLYIEHRWPYGLAINDNPARDHAANYCASEVRNNPERDRQPTSSLAASGFWDRVEADRVDGVRRTDFNYEKHLTPTAYGNAQVAEARPDAKWNSTLEFRLKCLPRGIIYLGSPYTLYPNGLHEAARHASRAAAALMARGFVVFAPISHGHAISCLSDDLPDSWEFWKAQCQPFIDAAAALVVLKLDGWKESVGLNYEIGEAERQGKPVVYVTPEELAVREETVEAGWKRRAA